MIYFVLEANVLVILQFFIPVYIIYRKSARGEYIYFGAL